jgi:hypothetical protein
MNVSELLGELQRAIDERAYFVRFDLLDQSERILKARIYISPNLFVQVYRNDQFDTSNFALIHNGRRLHGRDQVAGRWHRHNTDQPQLHDTSLEGQQAVNLTEFLTEVESILAALNLP